MSVISCSTSVFAAAYGAPVTIKIPYTHIYDADKNRTSDSFTYRIETVDGAPAPAGSRNGTYDYVIKGVPGADPVTGDIDLKIAFNKPGEYKYTVSAYVPERQDGFTYESRTYTIHVYVKNGANGGMGDPVVTMTGADGYKYGRLQLNPGHASEILPPDEVRTTTTPTGDGTVPIRGVPTDGGAVNDGAATGTPVATEEINDNETPLARFFNETLPQKKEDADCWALLNLIATILSVIIAGVLLKQYFERIDTEEDEYVIRREGKIRLLGVVPAVINVSVFMITADFSKPMALVDEWTPWILAMLVLSIATAFIAYKSYEEDEEQGIIA